MLGHYTRASRFISDAFGRYRSKTGAFGSNNSRISHNLGYNYVQNRPFVDGSEVWVGSVAAVTACYFRNTGPVPYTRRRHFPILSGSQEKELGDIMLERIKSEHKGKIVAPDHPDSTRVKKIGHDIVEVVKSQTKEEFEWEFVVVDEPTIVNSEVGLGGKIVVYTGLLNLFSEDDEIATVIAHEVGHAVAGHVTDHLVKFKLLKLIRSSLYNSAIRRRELEADYIGLILMASAGYDPRVAPHVYKKLDDDAWDDFLTSHPEIGADEARKNLITSHPTGETRVQQLLRPKVMEKALSIYKEVLAQRG